MVKKKAFIWLGDGYSVAEKEDIKKKISDIIQGEAKLVECKKEETFHAK